jgi:hypothetical protein
LEIRHHTMAVKLNQRVPVIINYYSTLNVD